MKTDRYTKAMLTIIALCLLWICANGVPTSTAQAQGGPYAIHGDGNGVFRVDTRTGEIVTFVDIGNDPRSGKGWELRAVTPR